MAKTYRDREEEIRREIANNADPQKSSNKEQRLTNGLAARLTFDEERAKRRAEQDKKDQELQDLIKGIQLESAARTHSIKDTKKALKRNPRQETQKRVTQLKEERAKSMQLDPTEAAALNARLSDTFRTLELNSNAHELDEWCHNCGCIHESEVIKESNNEDEERN